MTYILQCGDLVRLKEYYRPEEWVFLKSKDWKGFKYGIVVEIVSHQFTVNGNQYGDEQIPRNVSLHLYDESGRACPS